MTSTDEPRADPRSVSDRPQTEAAIRAALLARVARRWSTGECRVVEEFGTHLGMARADVAVVNGSLWGFEIKSAQDRLDRLPTQVVQYNEVFDYSVLVVAARHLNDSLDLIPPSWGVIEAVGDSDVKLIERRRPIKNAEPSPVAVALLLWRDELEQVVRQNALVRAGTSRLTRNELAEILASRTSRARLGTIVRTVLKGRQSWRDDLARKRRDDLLRRASASSRFLARRLQ